MVVLLKLSLAIALPKYNLARETKKIRIVKNIFRKMILQELQKQALQLSISERWELAQTLLESLKQKNSSNLERRNLSRLRGIAQNSVNTSNSKDEYVDYIIEKYQ
jgi:hypothetical protein